MEGDVSVYFRVVLVGFIVHLVAGSSCSDTSVGMESGKILDNKISASSEDSAKPAKNGRLNYTTGQSWCAATQDSNQYLQIDLGMNYIICAVATQGNSQADQWVKTYQLETSTDGTAWTKYKDGGQDKVFAANSDRNAIVKHILLKGIVAKLIRFLPKSHNGLVCLRAEVFGINRQLENVAVNKRATQGSATNGALGAALAVDGIPGGQCSTTTASANPWWEVDLGEIAVVFEVNILSQASPSEEFKVQVGGTKYQGTLKIPDGEPLSVVCSNRPIHNIIKISVQGNKVLTLCEVQVFLKAQAESAVNLALKKDAKQSSTRNVQNSGCNLASCAVDGNRANDFLVGNSCSHTKAGGEDNPWWRVDLGTAQPVSRVYVVNRIKFPQSLFDFELRIGNIDGEGVVSNPRCGYKYSVPSAEALTIYCSPPMYGRYVYIRIPGKKKDLVICEVEVYSDGNAESVNIALKKSAEQSSTFKTLVASKAVDGNRNNDYDANFCTRAGFANDPWWRVDLGTIQPVSRIYVLTRSDQYYYHLSDFELRIGNIKTNGETNNPKCGDKYSVPSTRDLNIYCNPPIYGRYVYIRIPGQNKVLMICELEVYADDKACTNQAIGTTNTASFPDSRWTASSSKSGNEPYTAQLDGAGAWIPSTNSGDDYLQIDVGAVYVICAVATQGNPKENEWTKTYKIKMSLNKVEWTVYQEASSEKVLTGNADRNSIVKYNLVGLHQARFVRFVPVEYNGEKALRIKIYGVHQGVLAPPTDLTFTNIQSRSATVQWKNPDDDPALGSATSNKIQYSSGGTTKDITTQSLTTSQSVTGLTPYTEYKVKVLLVNTVGQEPWSAEASFRTDSAVPEEAPTLTSVKALASQSIQVTWQKPGKINGALVGYKLLYKKKGQSSFTNKTLTGAATSHTLNSLEKWTEYEVKVQVYNSKFTGPASDVKTVQTLEDVPEKAPNLITATALTSQSIQVTWQKPDKINGLLVGYKVLYKRKGQSSFTIKTLTGEATSHTLNSLEKWTEYEVKVKVYNSKGDSPASDVKAVQTLEDVPATAPKMKNVTKLDPTTFNISWAPLPSSESNGNVNYTVQLTKLSGARKKRTTMIDKSTSLITSSNYIVLVFPMCVLYNTTVRAFTAVGPGPFSSGTTLSTQVSKGVLALSDFKATPQGNNYHLSWKAPNYRAASTLSYTVVYVGTKDYYKNFKDKKTEMTKDYKFTLKNLVPGTKYTFRVYAVTDCGKGIESSADGETAVTFPLQPVMEGLGETSIEIQPVEQKNGPISSYQVIVNSDDTLPGDYSSELYDYNKAIEKDLKFYITAELDYNNSAIEFRVGDDKEYGSFKNVKLAPGSHYIYVRAMTYDGKTSYPGPASKGIKFTITEESKTDTATGFPTKFVAPSAVIVLLIVLALVGFLVWRRRRPNHRSDKREGTLQLDHLEAKGSRNNLVTEAVEADAVSNPQYEEGTVLTEDVYSEADDGVPRPIPVLNFADYASRMKRNDSARLREEFKLLQTAQQFPWSVGKNPENKKRNRYANIITYDHSRVALEILDADDDNDYINASYMPGYSGDPKTYIATQGPTDKTVNEFWQMVWQEKSTSIVMLTNLVELNKVKCSQYWPSDSNVYGSVTVSFHKEEVFADYIVRTFILKKGGVSRQVRQFHFISWPDKGVPQHPTAVLTFRRKVRSWKPADSGPTVVHCSAGVGRTGTYIVIDAMMEQVKKQKTVDIFNYTQKLRKCRPHMVQTDEQYVFIHQAILEALTCGNTEISAQDLRIAMNKLSRASQGGGVNGYSQEFQRLQVVSDDVSVDDSHTGRQPENISKNRFPHIIPLDSSRVILRLEEGQGYINASFVDAYRERNAFIMTQAPLDSTIEDFWRMALQYNIRTVVMLNNLQGDNMNTPQYWPSQGAMTYGGITVEAASEEQQRGFVIRTLKVYELKRPKHVLMVQQHQYTGWPDKSVPSSHDVVLDLMSAVQVSQQQSNNAPIIVHCSDGVGRSGTFCAIYSAVERLKLDQVVDVFQSIKLLRVKRPGAVETLGQYVFCYEAVQNYLDSFSEYSNFSEA